MHLYLLFIVFLYVGGCNTRVVPLNFKLEKCRNLHSSSTENELIDESPKDEVETLGHNHLPDVEQSKDLTLDNPEEDNTTVLEILNRNASNMSADLTPKIKAMDEESNLESAASPSLSNLPEKKLNSTSEFMRKNSSDSRDSSETFQVNETLNDETTEDLTFKNEMSITSNSPSLDLEQQNNLDLQKIEVLNDTLNQSETFKIAKSNQKETFEFSKVVYSDQNETSTIFDVVNGTNGTDFYEFESLSNKTTVEEVNSSNAENITEKFKSSNLTSERFELANNSTETAGGIFSGFEFLINSEVARNAAKAIEVFNFSDPLTDHIMEENEFHSFLPAFNPIHDLDSPNQTDLETSIIINNRSGESNEIRADLNVSLPSEDKFSIVPNQAKPEETKKDFSIPFNKSEPLEGNKTESFDLEEFEGNVTSLSSPLEHTKKIELASVATVSEETVQSVTNMSTVNSVSKENITGLVSKENITGSVSNSSAVTVAECPLPGFCIFWFLSQDTCAVNEHCLGSRICCKIGCAKTCIEVESL